MSNRLTLADALADGKRVFNGRRQIFRTLALAAFLITLKLYSMPGIGHNARVALALAMIPLLIAGFLEWGVEDRSVDEFQREVRRDACSVVFRALFHLLWFFFLLDVGFGLPLSTQMPFELPPLTLGWRDAAFLPLLTYAVAYVVILKRRTRG